MLEVFNRQWLSGEIWWKARVNATAVNVEFVSQKSEVVVVKEASGERMCTLFSVRWKLVTETLYQNFCIRVISKVT